MFAPHIEFRSHAPARRIDWLYEQFAGPGSTSVSEFVQRINRAYYRQSVVEYHQRYVADIRRQYRDVGRLLRAEGNADRVVIDIGAGIGFEFDELQKQGIGWSRYVFIEPDASMVEQFRGKLGDAAADVEIIQSQFDDQAASLGADKPRLFVINSCLHHVVWIEEFLDRLRRTMRRGDQLLLGHEPNNLYLNSAFMFGNYFLRCLRSDLLPRKLGLWRSRVAQENARRWDRINETLLADQTLNTPMPSICIRRTIDYWVGNKGDWMQMNVPRDWNEGFWSPASIREYMGETFHTRYFQTYRHFGDPGGSFSTERLNRVSEWLFGRGGGSQFFMLLQCQGPESR